MKTKDEAFRDAGIQELKDLQLGPHLGVDFPPNEEDISKLIGFRSAGRFGKNVSLKAYNDWLGKSETGLRLQYDDLSKEIIIRERCSPSHYDVRVSLRSSLKAAFNGTYAKSGGRIHTAADVQDYTPDSSLKVPGAQLYPVVAEVGGSQSINQLNARARELLLNLPGIHVVLLVKVHDDATVYEGRLAAWTISFDAAGTVVVSNTVDFGRTDDEGNAIAAWDGITAGTRPSIIIPAHGAVPATSVDLGGILISLREDNGDIWTHGPAP